MLRGWYTQIRRAKTDEQIARAYAALQQTVQLAAFIPLLGFDESAIRRFNDLRKLKLRVGSNDLKIAATALENQATVVTRNHSDFSTIPGLKLEDWS
jgi:tRNA(fMet)-specific endonuclease VapC